MEIRCLFSASDSGKQFDLRCVVREKTIEFIAKNDPEAFPRARFSSVAQFPRQTATPRDIAHAENKVPARSRKRRRRPAAMRLVAHKFVALERGGHAMAAVVPHHFAHATQTYLALRLSHGQRDEVLNRLTHRHVDVGDEQDTVRTQVPGLGNARFGGCARPDQLYRELQIESDSFSLVRHVKLTVLDFSSKVNTSGGSKVPVRTPPGHVSRKGGLVIDLKVAR